jgi:hypothetical protein
MDEAFLYQLQKSIETLTVEGKLNEAYLKCNEVLKKYPDQKIFKKLKANIEDKLLNENEEKVKVGIKEAKKIHKEGRTATALTKIKDLLKLAPNSSKLRRLYLEYQEEYKSELEKGEADFIKKKNEEFTTLIEKEDYPKLLQEIDTLESGYRQNKPVQILIRNTRENLLKKMIREKSELLNSNKFDDIQSFIDNLKNIDKNSPIIKRLEEVTKRRKMGEQIGDIEEFIYTGEQNLVTLMKLRKYEEAVIVATEILKTNSGDKAVIKILKKARSKAFFQNRKETVKSIEKLLPALKAEYEQNKENFIRL